MNPAASLSACSHSPGSPTEHREEHGRVRVVGRHLDGVDRDHADARILQVADQLGDVALDLVGDAKAAVRDRWFVSHDLFSFGSNKNPRRLVEGGGSGRKPVPPTAFGRLP
jgi:hypothetical protein